MAICPQPAVTRPHHRGRDYQTVCREPPAAKQVDSRTRWRSCAPARRRL